MEIKVSKSTKFKDLPEEIKSIIYHLVMINTEISSPPKLDFTLFERPNLKLSLFDTQNKIDLFEQCVVNCEHYRNKKEIEYTVDESLDIIENRLDNFINANRDDFLNEMYECILMLDGRIDKLRKL
ncbi:hypothetical protein H311_03670 [Anncaliia algerae PRA109]|uniref:Uncharacterized protein n=1 Tax=Anncaliia algerae PRA339 TaxID=1288291 RepID=A0A059F0T9_9MICR|nr:hypothetical protein H311_03670 [Anncaliia algerae PRA109]KCZ80594.1 hypothetical protein H312_02014 [Anncaliia algerae PRA339]